MFDGEAFGKEIVSAVKAHLESSLAPILARLGDVEAKLAEPDAVSPEDIAALKASVEDVRKSIPEASETVGPEGPAGKDGKDGLDGVSFLVDKDGHLNVTMSNGTTKDLGQILGRDGTDGTNGTDGIVDLASVAKMIDEAVERQASDFAPDDVSESISLAIKTIAGYQGKALETIEHRKSEAAPVTVNMPPINVSFPEQQPPVVTMAAPVVNVAPPNVVVELPNKTGKEVTRVTEWDKAGRIKAFVKETTDG